MSLILKNYSLVEVIYLLIRFNNNKFFPWNKQYGEMVEMMKINKTHTCTPNTQKDKNGKG